MDLALDATDDADGFTEVGLSMPRRMHQRHEHLLRPLTPAGHIILHNRDAAREPILITEPLEDPLRRMLLLLRSRLVVPKNAVDHWNKWIKLRLRRRLLAHVRRLRLAGRAATMPGKRSTGVSAMPSSIRMDAASCLNRIRRASKTAMAADRFCGPRVISSRSSSGSLPTADTRVRRLPRPR